MHMPLVSTVIPTHNRPEMLAEAVVSVRAQTFDDYEIIIVSNGENPDMRRASGAVAAAYGCEYVVLDAGSVSAARNAGIERAKAEWVAFLDDDDLWLPEKLERQITEARQTGADMIACDWIDVFSDDHEVIVRPRVPDGWPYVKALSHYRWGALPSATMVRRRAFSEVGGFDVHQALGEDPEMWRRISWSHTIHQMDDVLVRRRIGHLSLTYRARPQGMTAHRRMKVCLYDVRHYFKMWFDTPSHLRFALAPMRSFLLLRLIEGFSPDWLLNLLHRLKPRTRWMRFRQGLGMMIREKAR